MDQNKTNLVPAALDYPAPSIRIYALNARQAILQGSGDGTGQTDPYIIGGED